MKNLPAMWETQVWSPGGEDPLEKGIATRSSILGASLVAQTLKNLPAMWEKTVHFLGQEDVLRREWLSIGVFLPRKIHKQRNLVSYSPRGCKESDSTEQLTLSLSQIRWHHLQTDNLTSSDNIYFFIMLIAMCRTSSTVFELKWWEWAPLSCCWY